MSNLLSTIESPADLRRLSRAQLHPLAAELRRSAREAVAAKTAEQAVAPAVHAVAPSHPQTRRYVGGIR